MSPGLPTDLARWQRIEAILDLALDTPPAERSALLDAACVGDPQLRAAVEAVLAADEQAGSFLGVPAGEYAPELLAEEEAEIDLVGHLVGPYRLLREIGCGGMGTVFEAEDTRLGRRVAVKLLPPEFSRDRRAKERFLREARAAAAVDHPNLCTIHDVGESEGRLFIVLALYEGETLRERIRRGPLPLTEARDLAIQVARGLARAHEAGIVHRDIKPANVMLTRRGEAKILDFGIARLQGDEASLTRTGASWGTPAYMSPEQARGEPVDHRTDLWSLGVLLYEMIAGRRPFGGESLEAVVAAILTQEPEQLERVRPDVSPALARIVERAMAKDPSERYASAADLLADLEAGKAPRRLPGRRRALRVSLLASALALLALLGVSLLWRPSGFAARPALRVAVLQPVVKSVASAPEVAFVASDVIRAVHAALLAYEDLQPLDPPEIDEGKGSEEVRLREADEALQSRLNCRGDSCQVTLIRHTPDGGVVDVSEPFMIQAHFESAFELAEAVRANVQQVYSDRRLRLEAAGATIKPRDYSAYVEIQRRLDSGVRLGRPDLERLDSLLQTSPVLVGAYVLATGVARSLGDHDRALEYSRRAEEVSPYDPRPLFARMQTELAAYRLDAAPETLARLAALAPGDVRVKTAEAELLEARGELEKSRDVWAEVASRRPTWRNILRLAGLELRLGACASARRRLGDLQTTYPDNQYVRVSLAAVEGVCGDLKRAAQLYEELVRTQPEAYLITNLGLVRFVAGDYPAAEAAYRRALALDPTDPWNRFSLATTLEARGDVAGARQGYRALAEELAAKSPLEMRLGVMRAQCLARLGQWSEAKSLAAAVLKTRPDDPQTLRQAAQIYVLLGDTDSVRYYTKWALEKGLTPVWFTTPEFHTLEQDPDFQALLDRFAPR